MRYVFELSLAVANIIRQVVKNIQLSSCDGLSFPFLVTWLFGASRGLRTSLTPR